MAYSKSLKNKILNGVLWQYALKLSSHFLHFIVSIILARLLSPDNFGTIALMGVFISISNIFIDSGFGNALIQKENIDDEDCNSVFYLNVLVSILLYGLIFILAPIIASYYQISNLAPLLRVLSLQIVFMGFYCVQNSILVRRMQFKEYTIIGIVSTLISSIIGILMALGNCGIWSLVISQLVNQFGRVVGLWLIVKWRPRCIFSFIRVKELFGYSSKILGGTLITVLCDNIYNIVIGKRYSATDLGFYNRGQLIPSSIIDSAATSFTGVLFPALSRVQNDRQYHLSMIRQSFRTMSFVIFLIGMLLVVLAPSIVDFLLGEKWIQAVPYMQIVSITFSISPIYLLNQSIQTSIGRSDLYLRTTVISKLITIILIFIASYISLPIMVISGAFSNIITLFITGRYNKELIGYSFLEQMYDILPSLFLSIVVGVALYFITSINMNSLSIIILGSIIGVILYLVGAWLFNFKAFNYLKSLLFKGKV